MGVHLISFHLPVRVSYVLRHSSLFTQNAASHILLLPPSCFLFVCLFLKVNSSNVDITLPIRTFYLLCNISIDTNFIMKRDRCYNSHLKRIKLILQVILPKIT